MQVLYVIIYYSKIFQCLTVTHNTRHMRLNLILPFLLPVECDVPNNFLDTKTGWITSQGADGKYYYRDMFEYKCYTPQYLKSPGHNFIQCGSDGNWSTSPLCVEQSKFFSIVHLCYILLARFTCIIIY